MARKNAPRCLHRIREELSESPAAQTNGTNTCSGGPARTELSLSQKSELVTGMSLGVPSKRHQLGRC